MHSLDLLQLALTTAREHGYTIRREWLGGISAGRVILGNRKILFVDISLSVLEQLEQVIGSLASDPRLDVQALDPALAKVLKAFQEAKLVVASK